MKIYRELRVCRIKMLPCMAVESLEGGMFYFDIKCVKRYEIGYELL